MILEQKIRHFLERYDRNNKAHVRAYKLIQESYNDSEGLQGIIEYLAGTNVNAENMKSLIISSTKKDPSPQAFFEHPRQEITTVPEVAEEMLADEESRKKLKIDGNSKESQIPGLTLIYDGKESDVFQVVENKPKRVPLEQNKQVSTDTVFYQNILPEIKIDGLIKPLENKDPYYLFPILQCKLCGLRFGKQYGEIFSQHIEDHRRYANALGEKTVMRREYFYTKAQPKIEKLNLTVEGEAEKVVWERESPICMICRKIVKKRWNDDLENWILEDGVKVNNKEVVHRSCSER